MIPTTMLAVHLIGYGGIEKFKYRSDVLVLRPKPNEVFIRVAAAVVNNTDINTRVGRYSKAITQFNHIGATQGFQNVGSGDASWCGEPLAFPRIQGADICGYIADVGKAVICTRIGERIVVRNMLRTYVNYRPYECWTIGSEVDGGFAHFCVGPSQETFAVECDWDDFELAAIPSSYSTAEGLLERPNAI